MLATANIINLLYDLNEHLENVWNEYHALVYAILFLIVFLETAFVIFPFLPGDVLLFACGTVAGMRTTMSPFWAFIVLTAAAVCGNLASYGIGWLLGPRAFSGRFRILSRERLEATRDFYAKYGGQTIVFARFLPLIRAFAPLVAGIGRMNFRRFLYFTVLGACLWVLLFGAAGYFFGNVPFVKAHLHLFALGMVLIWITSLILEVSHKKRKNAAKAKSASIAKAESEPAEP